VRLEVLQNENTPQKVVDMLCKEFADDKDYVLRRGAAEYTNDSEILAKLADDEDWIVRRAVAEHTDDPEILEKLADDEDLHVRLAVSNHAADPEILEKLARDEDANVRAAVAAHINDPEILAELAEDKWASVRREVAKRTTDPEILSKLADDKDEWVRQVAQDRLKSSKKPAHTRKTKKATQTDWSVPLYSISNYTEIEDEIDQVIEEAANTFAREYDGSTAKVECPSGVFDDGGQITIEIGNDVYEIDAEDILLPATSKNKKKDCVKTLISWMEKNLK